LKQYRQGDVLIVERTLPNKFKRGIVEQDKRVRGKVILAYGEATGHSHAIAQKNVKLFDNTFLQVLDKPAIIRHEEHAPVELPVGEYEIIRQRQQDPRSETLTQRRADYD
jgi:hypothetical protein